MSKINFQRGDPMSETTAAAILASGEISAEMVDAAADFITAKTNEALARTPPHMRFEVGPACQREHPKIALLAQKNSFTSGGK
jgi:hypothetical protein